MNSSETSDSSSIEESSIISSSNNEDEQELYQLVESLSYEKNNQLLSNLQNIFHRQNEMMKILTKVSEDLERSILFIPREMLQIDQYRSKLAHVKSSMLIIDEKIQYLQHRLNNLRASLPAISMVLMERPVEHGIDQLFYYRCVVPIGLKYRSKPSSIAPIIPGKDIKYREIVCVKERVFVCKENSIFLHVEGSGWLFENEGNLRYMERIGVKALPSHMLVDADTNKNTDEITKETKNDSTEKPTEKSNSSSKERVTFIDV